MSPLKSVSVDARMIFEEFSGYLHYEKDKESAKMILERIYREESPLPCPVPGYWTFPYRWLCFAKKIGLPKDDFLALIENYYLRGR
ncbi:hypothetical protein KJ885_04965 [Patescibacteria group bacterium]|nr:hypothetical protein [Patescibacteria group bacterium]